MSRPKAPGRRSSIRDVAKAAGVSISTVSRALRGYSDVNKDTRERIRQVALSLGYTPDAAGQALKSGKTDTIAVLVSGSHGPTLLDYFYAEVLGGIETHLEENDFSLLLVRADSKTSQRRVLQGGRCDGVIALGCDLPGDFLEEIHKAGMPLVLADYASWHPNIPSVTVANEAGGYEATQHLLDGGRSRIAFIAETSNDPNFLLRRQGFLRAQGEAQLEVDAARIQAGRLGLDGGYLATKKLLNAARFDAVFAANDMAAFGALRALSEANLNVPYDVAVVGFDDLTLAQYSHPPLSTVQVPRRQLGYEAASKLLELFKGNVKESLELPVSLIVRQSSSSSPTIRSIL